MAGLTQFITLKHHLHIHRGVAYACGQSQTVLWFRAMLLKHHLQIHYMHVDKHACASSYIISQN